MIRHIVVDSFGGTCSLLGIKMCVLFENSNDNMSPRITLAEQACITQ